jgi:dihydropteroate synthase
VKNARILYINDLKTANEEMRKVGVDADYIGLISLKSIFITIKLEDLTSKEANILKHEMLGKGGEVAVNRNVFSGNHNSDVIIMGTLNQYRSLIYKLNMQKGSLRMISNELRDLLDCMEKKKIDYFECCNHRLNMGDKTYIMGILNVTPDSFSDGGSYNNLEKALNRAKDMVLNGADIIDVGGESTRPGYKEVDALEEINRVVPVIEKLSKELEIPISVDTSKAIVAEKALKAGAHIVNDVWGLQKDSKMADVIAQKGAGVVVMHNSQNTDYDDLIGDVTRFLRKSIHIANEAGIRYESIMIDPGIGFGKTLEHNLEIMRKLNEFSSLNQPILIGTSRKSIVGNILELPVGERVEGTAATVTLGISKGADVVRVHDVREMSRVAKMTDAIVRE